MSEPAANEAIWRELLTGEGAKFDRDRRRNRRVPGNPRCKSCLIPLSGPVSRVLRLFSDLGPSAMNPNFCNKCETFVRTYPGGAEIELTLLFADIRGSTRLAERTVPRRVPRAAQPLLRRCEPRADRQRRRSSTSSSATR